MSPYGVQYPTHGDEYLDSILFRQVGTVVGLPEGEGLKHPLAACGAVWG